jgi:hypothetical protein
MTSGTGRRAEQGAGGEWGGEDGEWGGDVLSWRYGGDGDRSGGE